MARSSIDRDSLEYVKVPITTPPSVTISSQAVQIAVIDTAARPVAGDWKNASWDGTTAKTLVGPGQIALTPGTYRVWVRVTDNPEVPVLVAGTITVT